MRIHYFNIHWDAPHSTKLPKQETLEAPEDFDVENICEMGRLLFEHHGYRAKGFSINIQKS